MVEVVDLESIRIVQCDRCKKMIRYELSDRKGNYEVTPLGSRSWLYIDCPNCGNDIQF